MPDATVAFPAWPPGLWRRIVLAPRPGWITAGLEDDLHRFHVRLHHAHGMITAVDAEARRHPWTACAGAPGHLGGELAGKTLVEVAALPAPEHCTHLRDLAVLAAAHAGDGQDTRLDMRVADRVDGRTTATLCEDDRPVLEWLLDGTVIAAPAELAGIEQAGIELAGIELAGRDLRQLSRWQGELTARLAEYAHVLRRAVFVLGGRQFEAPAGQTTADMGPGRMGVCYNYQMPQAATSRRPAVWKRDFSLSGETPLSGFDPAAAMTRV